MASKVTDVGLIHMEGCPACVSYLPKWNGYIVDSIENKIKNSINIELHTIVYVDEKSDNKELSPIQGIVKPTFFPTIFKIEVKDGKEVATIFDGNRDNVNDIIKWIGIESKEGGSRRRKKKNKTISKKGKRKGGCSCGTRKGWFW